MIFQMKKCRADRKAKLLLSGDAGCGIHFSSPATSFLPTSHVAYATDHEKNPWPPLPSQKRQGTPGTVMTSRWKTDPKCALTARPQAKRQKHIQGLVRYSPHFPKWQNVTVGENLFCFSSSNHGCMAFTVSEVARNRDLKTMILN